MLIGCEPLAIIYTYHIAISLNRQYSFPYFNLSLLSKLIWCSVLVKEQNELSVLIFMLRARFSTENQRFALQHTEKYVSQNIVLPDQYFLVTVEQME